MQLRKLKLPTNVLVHSVGLHGHHRVRPHLLHHHWVHWSHIEGHSQTTDHHVLCGESGCLQAPIPAGPVHVQDSEGGVKLRLRMTLLIWDTNCLSLSLRAGDSVLSRP